MADYEIFRNQLLQTFPAYGHALWDPNPTNPDEPVKVGDVGFMRWGKFHRLFNALLPANHPSHDLGVPEHHEPLVPNLSNHINTGSLTRGHYCSGEVNMEPEPNTSASPDDLPQVSYTCARRQQGASSYLPLNVRRENTLATRDFGKWMLRYIDNWFAFARGLGLGIEQMEDIILVTGCDRTKSWTNITFLGNNVDARVSFGVHAIDGPGASVNFQFSPENVRGAVLNQGPEGTDLPENQSVFIRGFRVARVLGILPRHLKAAAGPSRDPEGYDYKPGREVVSIPADTKYRDPLHQLLDYIAERTPDCSMALVHDDDLERINGIGEGTMLQPDMLMDTFRRSNIEIRKVDCDLRSSASSPNTDTHAVRVAMLSEMFKNWKIAKDTALQPQASSLTTQNIGIRHPSESLSSSTPTSPDSLSSLGPTNRGEISPPRHADSEPWGNRPCFIPQVGTTHSRREVGRGGTYLQVPMSPRHEIEMGHNISIQPPVGPDHILACLQSQPTQPTNVPHHLGRGFVHQQNPETVVGIGSQLLDQPMGSYTMQEGESPNASGFIPARQVGTAPLFPEANVPGQGPISGEHSKQLSYYIPQGEFTYPGNGFSSWSAYSQVLLSPRLQLGIGRVRSSQQPPMGRSYHPAFCQMAPSPLANILYCPHHSNSSHLQNPEPVTATDSHYQNLTGVQHAVGGSYNWTPTQAILLPLSGPLPHHAIELPVLPQLFDLIGEGNLPPPMPVLQSPTPPHTTKRRALIVGINYTLHPNPDFRLKHGVEDAHSVANFLCANLDYSHDDIRILTDEGHAWNPPTKENILQEMRILVQDAQPHDSFFLYFSGHALQTEAMGVDEPDGLDECICAIDYLGDDLNPNSDTPGLIADDLMHEIMVKLLPPQCRLTAMFDSCNSGTLLDISTYSLKYSSNGVENASRIQDKSKVFRHKVSLSASKVSGGMSETRGSGALRSAFNESLKAYRNGLSWKDLIESFCEFMKRHRFPQRPQRPCCQKPFNTALNGDTSDMRERRPGRYKAQGGSWHS